MTSDTQGDSGGAAVSRSGETCAGHGNWHDVPADVYRAGALEALERIRSIGDAEEQRVTGDALLDALAQERAREGRPF